MKLSKDFFFTNTSGQTTGQNIVLNVYGLKD
jgi:hypothetical protein